MLDQALFQKVKEVISQQSTSHASTLKRRMELLRILWDERYLTRQQLICRVNQKLGRNSFGKSATKSAFYSDMKIIEKAFQAVDIKLAFNHRRSHGGYFLVGEPAISEELAVEIKNSADEVDSRQIEIYQKLTPADRFRQGCEISDLALRVVAYRILMENPGMNLREANRIALKRAYD